MSSGDPRIDHSANRSAPSSPSGAQARRQPARLPRHRIDDSEAARGHRRRRELLRALHRERSPRALHARRRSDATLRRSPARSGGAPRRRAGRACLRSRDHGGDQPPRELMQLTKGDEVVFPASEHHANWLPWRHHATAVPMAIDADGVPRWETLPDPADVEDEARLDFGHVSNVTGAIAPVADVVAHRARARDPGPPRRSAVAVSPADRREEARRRTSSPRALTRRSGRPESAVLYAKRALLERFSLYQVGGGMVALNEDIGADHIDAGFIPRDAPFRFEAGTPAIEAAIGFGAAIRWMRAIGMDAIRAHDVALADKMVRELSAIPGVRVLARDLPADKRVALVTFVVDAPAHDAGERGASALRPVRRVRLGRSPLHARAPRARQARRDGPREPARVQHVRRDRSSRRRGARDRRLSGRSPDEVADRLVVMRSAVVRDLGSPPRDAPSPRGDGGSLRRHSRSRRTRPAISSTRRAISSRRLGVSSATPEVASHETRHLLEEVSYLVHEHTRVSSTTLGVSSTTPRSRSRRRDAATAARRSAPRSAPPPCGGCHSRSSRSIAPGTARSSRTRPT